MVDMEGMEVMKKMPDKISLRKKMLDLMRSEPGPDPALVADMICALDEYKNASHVLAYIPLRGEIDVSLLLDRAIRDGKTVAVPDTDIGDFRIVGDGWRDDLVRLSNSTFTTGSYGVLNIIDINSRIGTVEKTKGIILVPGLAFTEFGTRLGRGAGYYDQLLHLMGNSGSLDFISIGICRKSQLLDDIPQQPHDAKVRMVITF